MTEDLYKVLGISRTATDDEIRAAYRKMAKELHPDLNPGDAVAEEKFKKVSAAFRILGDAELRKKYDRGEIDAGGQERPDAQFYREFAGGRYGSSDRFEENSSFRDIFGDLFGQDGNAGFRSRGEDIRYSLDVEFLEAAQGAKKRIKLPDGGTLDMNVPSGVTDGQVLRLKGKGEAGLGGTKGDALIEISIKPHDFFERDGNNLSLELPITIYEAVLGAKVEVPTLSGRVTLTIPKGSSSGKLLRLRGKGITNSRTNKTGDLLIRLRIILPEEVDTSLSEMMDNWQDNHKYNPRKNL